MNEVVSQLLPKEQKELIKKWKDIGLLRGCEDEWQEAQLSSILENQLLLNNMQPKTSLIQQILNRISIPLVRRVFDPQLFVPYHIVSVQTLAGPTGLVYWLDRYGVFRNTQVGARGKTMKTKVPLFIHAYDDKFEDIRPWFEDGSGGIYLSNTYPEVFGHRSQIMLDNEAELISSVAGAMRREIVNEVIFDLRSVVDLHLTHMWKNPEKLADFIRVASSEMAREIGGNATWVITSPSIAEELAKLEDFEATDIGYADVNSDVYKKGILQKRWWVFVNPNSIPNEIIFGKRNWDNPLDSGYFYSPYCPVAFAPDSMRKTEDPDTIIISRYAKKATEIKYYAIINVIGYAPQRVEVIPQNPELPEGTGREIVLDENEEILEEVTLDTTIEAEQVSL